MQPSPLEQAEMVGWGLPLQLHRHSRLNHLRCRSIAQILSMKLLLELDSYCSNRIRRHSQHSWCRFPTCTFRRVGWAELDQCIHIEVDMDRCKGDADRKSLRKMCQPSYHHSPKCRRPRCHRRCQHPCTRTSSTIPLWFFGNLRAQNDANGRNEK